MVEFHLQGLDALLDSDDIHLLFLLKGIDVPRNIEIVFVFGNFRAAGDVGVFVYGHSLAVSLNYPGDFHVLPEFILVLVLLEVTAGINKEDVGALAPVTTEDEDGGRDPGAKKTVGRQTDDGVEEVLFDKCFANPALCTTPEEHPVGGQ